MNDSAGRRHHVLIGTVGLLAVALLTGFYTVVNDAVEVSAARRVEQSAGITQQHRRPGSVPASRLALAAPPGQAD